MAYSLPSFEEIALGLALNHDPMCPPHELVPDPRPPKEALEAVLVDLMSRRRLAVAFSGGVDSSGLLCLATDAARRHGFPDPIAVTTFYPNDADASEDEWQELVIRHLGLADWIRIEITDEEDLLGAAGQEGLREHGVLWPPLMYRQMPMIDAVPGCALVLGNGGDELTFPTRTGTARLMLKRRVKWNVAAFQSLGRDLRPRLYWTGLVDGARLPEWIRADAKPRLRRMLRDHPFGEAFVWTRSLQLRTNVPWALRGHHNIVEHGRVHDVEMSQPFTDRGVVNSMLAAGGRWGFSHRAPAAYQLFGDTLPAAVRKRRDKAEFGGVVIGSHTQAFIDTWDGSGLPDDLVDAAVFRRACTSESPGYYTYMLLQYAWLQQQA